MLSESAIAALRGIAYHIDLTNHFTAGSTLRRSLMI
jgi:hypothetical protein